MPYPVDDANTSIKFVIRNIITNNPTTQIFLISLLNFKYIVENNKNVI